MVSPTASKPQQQVLTSAQQQGNQSVSLNRSDEISTPKMHENRAYGCLPQAQPAFTSSESKQLRRGTIPDSSFHSPPGSQSEVQKSRLSLQVDSVYEYVDCSSTVTSYGKSDHAQGSSSTIAILNPRSASIEEEGCTPMQSLADYLNLTPSKTDPSPENPMDVSKILQGLSHFNAAQMEILIDMLRRTVAIQPQNINSPIPEQAAVPGSTPPPKPSKGDPEMPKASGSLSATKTQERPSQLRLSTSKP